VSNFELARKQSQIQAILDGITDVMIVLSPDFRIVSVNREFYNVFGAQEPVGEFCYQVFHQTHQPCSSCPVITALESNRVCRHHSIYPVDGKNRHFEITASRWETLMGSLALPSFSCATSPSKRAPG